MSLVGLHQALILRPCNFQYQENKMKKALITGITGMDGSHLADFLLSKGYKVFGLIRRSSQLNLINIKHIESQITLLHGDLTDQNSLLRALKDSNPDEVYNLGAQSFVGESWNSPQLTTDVTAMGVLKMLEAIREYNNGIRFYQASSSEMFGRMIENPANEKTPFYPRSPYGVSKLYGHWITINYRESYDIFACSGILFNHESERRGIEFVTRKISDGVARIHLGLSDSISLGNLDSRRDWGYAPDYVEAMWLMLQQDRAEDYVIATGNDYSIRDFLSLAFEVVDIQDWEKYIKVDKRFFRPAEVDVLRGNFEKAKNNLNWTPKTGIKDLVKIMINNDIRVLESQI
jgi:GDPmannose 4,6-dehydratase